MKALSNIYLWTRPTHATRTTRGTVVQWLSLLHNFIQQSLKSGSAQV